MKTTRKLLMTMLAVLLVVFVSACGGASDEPETKPDNGSANETETDQDESENIDHDEESDEEDGLDDETSGETNQESPESNNSTDEVTESSKEDYLKELNDMEEADRNEESATTTEGLEDQEADRYKKWDEALNEIYGVLEEQLGAEDMDKLREDQRNWVKERDEVAKEASLKYEGGTTESLEYVATQATLTKERSYELVANYMK